MGPDNRTLDLEWLEDFVALAESGNFSRAAEARAIAQPAFSRHIRSLEEWVGVDLIDRGAHPVELTGGGRKFLPLVRDVLASLEAARIKARLAQGQAAASLRFAVTHALSITFFPRWLGALETRLRPGPIETHVRSCARLRGPDVRSGACSSSSATATPTCRAGWTRAGTRSSSSATTCCAR